MRIRISDLKFSHKMPYVSNMRNRKGAGYYLIRVTVIYAET